MKRPVYLSSVRRAILSLCLLSACFLFSSEIMAQHFPPLVSTTTAQARLDVQIPQLESNLNALPPGTPSYANAERELALYMHTSEELQSGETVENALMGAFSEYSKVNGQPGDIDEWNAETNYGDSKFFGLVNYLKQ